MTSLNERYVEELYYRADALFEEASYAEAKEILLELLEEDPTYAKAHNLLGWLYTHQLYNLVAAERHLKLAVKYGEGYAAPLMNYAVMLFEANRYEELISWVDKYLETHGVDKAYLLILKGNALESKQLYRKAYKTYEEARRFIFNGEFLTRVDAEIKRLKQKINWLEAAFLSL
jgi:tetratricopeptide (TPR) repeat protein